MSARRKTTMIKQLPNTKKMQAKSKVTASIETEKQLAQFHKAAHPLLSGPVCVIGADEVGRGDLAGPIVGCAVLINPLTHDLIPGVKDSKKLSYAEQADLYAQLTRPVSEGGVYHRLSAVNAPDIDEMGIQPANKHVLAESVYGVMKQAGCKLEVEDQKKAEHEHKDVTAVQMDVAAILLDGTVHHFMQSTIFLVFFR